MRSKARRRSASPTIGRLSRIDPARLDDLDDVLAEVRSWPGIEERSFGTFYVRRKPFLHFHAGRDTRRADVRQVEGWLEIELPEPLPAAVRRQFHSILRHEYEER